jgi:hypothetical protein
MLSGSELFAGVGSANNAGNVGNVNNVYGVAGSNTFKTWCKKQIQALHPCWQQQNITNENCL